MLQSNPCSLLEISQHISSIFCLLLTCDFYVKFTCLLSFFSYFPPCLLLCACPSSVISGYCTSHSVLTTQLTVFWPPHCSSCTNPCLYVTHTSTNSQGASGLDGKPGLRVSLTWINFIPQLPSPCRNQKDKLDKPCLMGASRVDINNDSFQKVIPLLIVSI